MLLDKDKGISIEAEWSRRGGKGTQLAGVLSLPHKSTSPSATEFPRYISMYTVVLQTPSGTRVGVNTLVVITMANERRASALNAILSVSLNEVEGAERTSPGERPSHRLEIPHRDGYLLDCGRWIRDASPSIKRP